MNKINSICNLFSIFDIGPASWKDKFPFSRGSKQSPINICTAYSICIPAETIPPLRFSSEYHSPPKDIRAFNDGHNGKPRRSSVLV